MAYSSATTSAPFPGITEEKYNMSHVCTYCKPDAELFLPSETAELTEDGRQYVRNLLYREDLLDIFMISASSGNSDDDEQEQMFSHMTKIMLCLYELLHTVATSDPRAECARMLIDCVQKASHVAAKHLGCDTDSAHNTQDVAIGMCILYSYEYMQFTHPAMCAFLCPDFDPAVATAAVGLLNKQLDTSAVSAAEATAKIWKVKKCVDDCQNFSLDARNQGSPATPPS